MAITKYPASLYGETLTAGSTINTLGAYSELVASLPADIVGVYVSTTAMSIGGARFLLNLATGAASSEVNIVTNLMVASGSNGGMNALGVYVPVAVAAGARLSANCQCQASGSRTIGVALQTVSGSGSAVPVTYGADTANTRGTQVDPGATPGTKGAYVELTPATSAAHDYVIALLSLGGNTAPADASFSLDIATGAASSEVVVLPDLTFITTSGDNVSPLMFAFPLSIASGTRLSARAASTTSDATDRLFEVTVIGVTNSGFNGGGGGGSTEWAAAYIG